MQTRTYGELFKLISALCGTGQQLAVPEQDQLRQFINRRFQEAFDSSPIWPRYLVTSEERLLALYKLSNASSSTSTAVNQNYRFLGISSGSNTTPGTNVYQGVTSPTTIIYKNSSNAWIVTTNNSFSTSGLPKGTVSLDPGDSQVVQFTEADAVKNDSLESVTTWTPRSGTDLLEIVTLNLIPYAESSIKGTFPTIGNFNRIHRKQSFKNNSAIEYEFFVDFDGANILNIANTNDTSAFVTYKKQFTPYTITTGYYDSALEVPQEFYNYIAHTAFADFLRMQGKNEQAVAEEQVGAFFLAQELEKVDIISNNNTVNKRFSTYVNRQSR